MSTSGAGDSSPSSSSASDPFALDPEQQQRIDERAAREQKVAYSRRQQQRAGPVAAARALRVTPPPAPRPAIPVAAPQQVAPVSSHGCPRYATSGQDIPSGCSHPGLAFGPGRPDGPRLGPLAGQTCRSCCKVPIPCPGRVARGGASPDQGAL